VAEHTAIPWTHHSHNEWIGCTKLSEACLPCYAWRQADVRLHLVRWGNHPRHLTSPVTRGLPYGWDRKAELAGERRRVFANSWSDIFDNQVPREWRDGFWTTVAGTPHLDWLLLTKRPHNIGKMLPADWGPYPNVWLGVTAENQRWWNRRVPLLARVAARVRFVSVEPMLEPIDIGTGVDWVIVGGESGPANARVTELAWVRSLRDQCRALGIAFFVKQLMERGRQVPFAQWPEDLRVRQYPIV
jgi:protein gp37